MNLQSRKQNLIWGGLLIVFGLLAFVETFTNLSAWVWVAILTVAGLGVFAIYRTSPTEWGFLIPAYTLWVVAGLIALITLNILRDEAIATYVLTAIALPFLVAFLRQRTQWGLLIPAYVLLAVGIMVGLIGAGILNDLLIPAYVMFAIAIPFLVVYVRDTQQWWPLIPGGIMTIIGLSFLIAESALQFIGPVLLILAGIWILARQFIGQEMSGTPETPALTDPEVDDPLVE